MTKTPVKLIDYKINVPADIPEFGQPKIKNFKFDMCQDLSRLEEKAGIYLFVLHKDGDDYKLYIGSSTSVHRRMKEYCRQFQPRSPDDSKVRLVAAAIDEMVKADGMNLTYTLYVKDCHDYVVKELRKEEHSLIGCRPKPLINRLFELNDEIPNERRNLEKSYKEYFGGLVRRALE